MNTLWISWKNIKRRKGRAVLLGFALASGITLFVALLATSKALRDEIDVMLDEYGANIVITAKPSFLPLSYGSITVPGFTGQPGEIDEVDIYKIKRIKNSETINIIAPKLLAPASVEGVKALLVGVRFKDELRLKKWWRLSGAKPSKKEEIIIGSKAAQKLGKKPGDLLLINGKKFKIASVLNKVGTQEDDLIYADLSVVQELFNKKGKLTAIEVAAWCQTCPIERIVAQIGAKLPWAKVTSFKEIVAAKKNALVIINRFTGVLAATIMSIGALVVASSTLASINRRMEEIGILRAIGYRKAQVLNIMLFDTLAVCIASALIGWAVGTAVAKVAASFVAGPRVSVSWSFSLAGISVLVSALIGALAGYLPAQRASNLEPLEALRSF